MMRSRERLRTAGVRLGMRAIPGTPAMLGLLGMLGMLTIALSGCSGPATTALDEAPAVPVRVAPVVESDIADTFEAGGVVEARTTATIAARILAPVLEVRVAPGDRVRAGQTLIVLDAADLAARTRSGRAAADAAEQGAAAAVAEQRAAEAALTLARATHARIVGLHEKRSATTQEFDDATGALQAADARVAGATARAQAARANLDSARAAADAAATTASFAVLVAPFDGLVTEKLVEPGNMATPGTPLMRLEDTRGFRLEVRVDESRIGTITPGAVVPVSFDLGSGVESISGTATEISRTVDSDARAFLVKIALPETAALRSGMFGRAHIVGRTRRALTVPDGAVERRGQIASVFVVDQDIARLRLVDLSGSEVLAGLSDGEVVIVGAPPTVTDGRRVSVGGL